MFLNLLDQPGQPESARSARNKGNKNATGTGFHLQEVTQFMDFIRFESVHGS